MRMAPFKLKFRMGSSRSASQEGETEILPTVTHPLLGNSTGTITSSNTTIDSELNSFGSSNDQRNLIPTNQTNIDRTGITNPTLSQSEISNLLTINQSIAYERVTEENKSPNEQDSTYSSNQYNQKLDQSNNEESLGFTDQMNENTAIQLHEHTESDCGTCTSSDPTYCCVQSEEYQQNLQGANMNTLCTEYRSDQESNPPATDDRIEFNDYSGDTNSEHNVDGAVATSEVCLHNQTYAMDSNNCNWTENNISHEIITNKSSKKIYKDIAKQWGITCKMSDQCRCMECQGHYFDCEYEENEHQKTDGGLGAGTPMFISEVMHGTACTIL